MSDKPKAISIIQNYECYFVVGYDQTFNVSSTTAHGNRDSKIAFVIEAIRCLSVDTGLDETDKNNVAVLLQVVRTGFGWQDAAAGEPDQ